MNSKKIISAILAGACTLSMASIASFAADETTKMTAAGSYDLSTDADYTAPVIDVTLPTSIKAVINPYQIVIDVSSGVKTGTDGITSPEYSIVNNSTTFGIKVGAKLTAKGTGIAVAATPDKIPTKEDSEKTAFAFLNTAVGKEADTKGTYASDEYTGKVDDGQLAFAEDKPEKATVLMALEEKTKNNKGFFKVQGAVTDPENVEKPYATTDKLALGIIFEVNPYNTGAGGNGGGNGGGSTVTPGLTADLTQANFTGTGITAFAKGSNANEYNITVNTGTNGGNAIVLNLTGLVDNSQTIASKTADNTNVSVAGIGMNVNVTPAATGSSKVTITLSDNKTIILNFTLT